MRPKGMTLSIDAAGRARLAELCASFTREEQPVERAGLKHAAVALVVVDGMNKNDPCLLLTRRSPRLRSHAAQWALPGGRCDKGETPVDAALRELDEELGLKISADDALAVLDERLRVRGIHGLRVADASVMPTICGGNTNAPTIMIGEKAADMIRADARA